MYPMYIKDLLSVLNNLTEERALGPDGFTAGFYKTFKKKKKRKKKISTFHNLFQKNEAKKTLPNSFYENNITLALLNTIKIITRKDNQISM